MAGVTTRTRYGLTLVRNADEAWETLEGGTTIGRVDGITLCEAPHPFRYRHPTGGWLVNGYCEGFEEHHYKQGWDIRGHRLGLPDDIYRTLDEAWEVLAKALS